MKAKFPVSAALVFGVAFLGGAYGSEQLYTPKRGSFVAQSPTKWEYCGVRSARGEVALYRPGGVEEVKLPVGSGPDATARAFAVLGEEGWELVGSGSLAASAEPTFLFKRPVR